jgi:hypothetical protein
MKNYDEYFTDVINTQGNENYGMSFLGAGFKNPVKTARDIGSTSTGEYPQTTYLYEYDEDNRIIKQERFLGASAFTPVNYTYY